MKSIKFKVKLGRNPNGQRQILTLSSQKGSRVKNLMYKYKEIGFIEYSLIDLAEMSLMQWKRREYPIPEGYVVSYNKILRKITIQEKYMRKITDQSESNRKKYLTPRY